jgi:membrane-associated protease RseP (regulator of RpoE activity)
MALSDAVDPANLDPPADPPDGVRLRPKFRDRVWVHTILLLVTVATTTLAGSGHYLGFVSDFVRRPNSLPIGELLAHGLWYSLTILAILGTHELGHYLACRYYRVDASLPYFLPVPPPFFTGTLGAFIRIREPIPSKRVLFDIGVAGPIAGFLVAVPALFIGLSLSHVVRLPERFEVDMVSLGEPLLFRAASWLVWGSTPEGYSLNMHPMAFAAWFGLLATALNLIPIGQLDGGHISYAVLGRRSTIVTMASIVTALVLTYYSTSWLVWTVLMMVMLFAYGPHHPRTLDEHVPLDPARKWLAFAAFVILVLCFTPAPIEPLQLIGR